MSEQNFMRLPGRSRSNDLMAVTQIVLDSLMWDEGEGTNYWTQHSKKPLGNSGGQEHDIVERLGIESRACPHCDERLDDEAVQYATSLLEAAIPYARKRLKHLMPEADQN